ncbi:type II toxin-antitoxin system RelE/ParE family toxin, partial [Companilactobacillus jidongensis]|uniref:type II toxin-antitoxin system RelE/ParE family toxin n=1 Tax=Companilactobacillus jidongensis TaxID=2486006 RepID=UPI0013DD88E5
RKNGKNEFLIFYNSLNKKDKEKLLSIITNVEKYGLITARKLQWVKKIDNNLYELRSKVGTNIQRAIYFHIEDENYIITHGFTKKTQKTPIDEINHGKELRREYLTDKEK